MVNALHKHFPAVYLIGQSRAENMLDLNIPDGAALHGKQIVLLIDLASVHHPADFLFRNTVQPDSGGAAIAFPKLNKSQILFHFIILLLKFAQIDEVIQRLCTPPEIIMPTINRTGATRTGLEIVNRL